MGGRFGSADSAVSQVVAPALMMVVSLSVIAGTGMVVMEQAEQDGMVHTVVDLVGQDGVMVLRHNGGDHIAAADSTITVYFADENGGLLGGWRLPMTMFMPQLGDGMWNIGDRIALPGDIPGPAPGAVVGASLTYHGIETPSIMGITGDTSGPIVDPGAIFERCAPDGSKASITVGEWDVYAAQGYTACADGVVCHFQAGSIQQVRDDHSRMKDQKVNGKNREAHLNHGDFPGTCQAWIDAGMPAEWNGKPLGHMEDAQSGQTKGQSGSNGNGNGNGNGGP